MAADESEQDGQAARADDARQWINTGLMLVLTVGWLAYVAYTIAEKRKADRQMKQFQQDIRERADLGRWEMEHGSAASDG